MSDFQARIRLLLDQHSATKIAKDTGISKTQLYRLCESGRDTTRENLIRITAATGTNLIWLATGEGPMYADGTKEPVLKIPAKTTNKQNSADSFSDRYALIPLYNVSAAAGHGAVVEHEEVVDSLAFKREWISQTLNATPADLYLINVQGESMTPTLHPGDVILVDRRNGENITTDGIYVIRMGDSLLVKRIQRLPGQKLRISSDNPAYQPFELKIDEAASDELAIIGRVVWSGRRM
ncbi:MAG: S26 family signal peptidase [Saccharospirillaceae bacterium]|nr:S26 family signal peptidase [Saccharospirillaceae bacterium]MCD8530889.1 S26 family signal peptidase [Saccharospirillaceae bacterium]